MEYRPWRTAKVVVGDEVAVERSPPTGLATDALPNRDFIVRSPARRTPNLYIAGPLDLPVDRQTSIRP
jgi:hypothetical protein